MYWPDNFPIRPSPPLAPPPPLNGEHTASSSSQVVTTTRASAPIFASIEREERTESAPAPQQEDPQVWTFSYTPHPVPAMYSSSPYILMQASFLQYLISTLETQRTAGVAADVQPVQHPTRLATPQARTEQSDSRKRSSLQSSATDFVSAHNPQNHSMQSEPRRRYVDSPISKSSSDEALPDSQREHESSSSLSARSVSFPNPADFKSRKGLTTSSSSYTFDRSHSSSFKVSCVMGAKFEEDSAKTVESKEYFFDQFNLSDNYPRIRQLVKSAASFDEIKKSMSGLVHNALYLADKLPHDERTHLRNIVKKLETRESPKLFASMIINVLVAKSHMYKKLVRLELLTKRLTDIHHQVRSTVAEMHFPFMPELQVKELRTIKTVTDNVGFMDKGYVRGHVLPLATFEIGMTTPQILPEKFISRITHLTEPFKIEDKLVPVSHFMMHADELLGVVEKINCLIEEKTRPFLVPAFNEVLNGKMESEELMHHFKSLSWEVLGDDIVSKLPYHENMRLFVAVFRTAIEEFDASRR